MPYTNHVYLVGLNQARAHQRGEPVGKPVKYHRNTDKLMEEEAGRAGKDTDARGYVASHTKAFKREVAEAEGRLDDVAVRFNVSAGSVRNWRLALAAGKL